jgi:hypothetical protein
MSQRVDEREWVQYQWPYLLRWLGGAARVDQLGYETGAFVRKREFESPSQILQLLMTWAVAERSLRETALLAAEAEMADVSNVALLRRFVKAEPWIGALLGEYLLGEKTPAERALPIRLLDASSLNRPGTKASDLRLHLSLTLRTHTIDSVELTDATGGETLERFDFRAGELVIADRGYAHRAGLNHVVKSGAYFLVRIPWNNVPLEDAEGEPLDIPAALETLEEATPGEFPVRFRTPDGDVVACRLVAIRKSEPAAEQARRKASAERRKHGKIDLRTLQTAGYVFVLTNLPEGISTESVLQLYRLRWQIELKFKALKSVIHLDNIPARSETLARVYIMTKLLVALVIDDLIESASFFSPWGYPLAAG